jgi:predicted nucleic acid-binding protein
MNGTKFCFDTCAVVDFIHRNNEAVEEEAIMIRKTTKLKLPDCIVAATGKVLGAVLLTSDDNLLKLSWPDCQVLNIL